MAVVVILCLATAGQMLGQDLNRIIPYHIVVRTADVTDAGSSASAYIKFYGTATQNGNLVVSPERDMGGPDRDEEYSYTMETRDLGVPVGVRLDLSKGLWMGNEWKPAYVKIFRNSRSAEDQGGGYAEWFVDKWHGDDPVWYKVPSHREEAAVSVSPTGEVKESSLRVISITTFDNSSSAVSEPVNKYTQLWRELRRVEMSDRDVDNISAYAEVSYTASGATGGLGGKVGASYSKELEKIESNIEERMNEQSYESAFQTAPFTYTIYRTTFQIPYRNEVYVSSTDGSKRIVRQVGTQIVPLGGERMDIPRKGEDGQLRPIPYRILNRDYLAHMSPDQLRDVTARFLPTWRRNGWVVGDVQPPPVRVPASQLLTDGAYYWILNGDGSRSWLRRAPSCRRSAQRMSRAEVDRIPKRHSGDNGAGYALGAEDAARVCSETPSTSAQLLTDGSYYWVVNTDGSRNWIDSGSVTGECRSRAQRTTSIERYPKRHGGTGGYTLRGEDAQRACSI